MDRVDCVVVGAGVIGLAIARELALAGQEVVVLESESRHGTGTSSRNSGVIHAGLYYPAGSLKALWCVRGKHLLYEYAASRQVVHANIGKLIVGQAEDEQALANIQRKANANGVDDLAWLSTSQIRDLEPALSVQHALLSPSTGIVDVHSLMHALEGDLTDAGGMVAVQSRLMAAEQMADQSWQLKIHVGDAAAGSSVGEEHALQAGTLINAAGLDADAVAMRIHGPCQSLVPQTYFAKGNYASLSGRSPFQRLIYPVPVPGGLGTHLTIDTGGGAQFGPDVEWLGPVDPQREPGSSHASVNYQVDPARLDGFARDVARWWPSVSRDRLVPGYSGVRPKIAPLDAPAADFMVLGPADHGQAGLVQLFGMESPGLTACLAIAQAVHTKLLDR
ncbi:MAG: NAD(P)/FAD-dependent oxidoreductase [Burkholderiaceae bacterium]